MKSLKDTLKRTFLRKRTLILLLAVIGEVCLKIAEKSSFFAEEIFGRHIFKWMSVGISAITGIFPFSVAEFMIIAAPFLAIALIAGFIVKLVKNKKDFLYRILTFILNAACMGSVIWYVLFGITKNCKRKLLRMFLVMKKGLSIIPNVHGFNFFQ